MSRSTIVVIHGSYRSTFWSQGRGNTYLDQRTSAAPATGMSRTRWNNYRIARRCGHSHTGGGHRCRKDSPAEGTAPTFTEGDVTAIRAIRAAGPDEQLQRYQPLADKQAAIQALDGA